MKVKVGTTELEIRPAILLDYVEKVDFIKMRRGTAYDLVRGFPRDMTEENYKIAVEIAMRVVYTNSSSVSVEEELAFDRSEEGFFWKLWKCIPRHSRESALTKGGQKQVKEETWQEGLNRAKRLWESASPEEKTEIRLAFLGIDETQLAKKSDGPSQTSQPEAPDQQKSSES